MDWEKVNKKIKIITQGTEYSGEWETRKTPIHSKSDPNPKNFTGAAGIQNPFQTKLKRVPLSRTSLHYIYAVKRSIRTRGMEPAPYNGLPDYIKNSIALYGATRWAINQPEFEAIEEILTIAKRQLKTLTGNRSFIHELEEEIFAREIKINIIEWDRQETKLSEQKLKLKSLKIMLSSLKNALHDTEPPS